MSRATTTRRSTAPSHGSARYAELRQMLESETLARVTAALAHLEAGTYGRCMECGGEIAEARLRALPFASRCRDCEDAVERTRERQRNGSRAGLQPSGPGDTPDRTRR